MQSKGQALRLRAAGRAPQIVLGVNPKTMPCRFKTLGRPEGARRSASRRRVSSTNVMANFFLAKAGIKPSDVSIIGVGAGNGAVAAMRSGQIDAISNLDPVITLLQRSGDLKIISDTASWPRPTRSSAADAGSLPVRAAGLHRQEPGHRAGAGQRHRARRQVDPGGRPGEIIKAVPENYLLGDRAVYIDAFMAAKGALARRPVPRGAPTPAFRALQSIDPALKANRLRPGAAVHQRVRAQGEPAKYPKG